MKAKRRQELKTNDLAHWLEEMSISFKDWGVYIIVGVAVVVIGFVIASYMRTAKADQVGREYAELRAASQLAASGDATMGEEIRQSIAKVGDLAAQSSSESFKLDARIRQAEMALQQAESSPAGIDTSFLEEARSAFQKIADAHQDRTIYYGRALFGLFQVEADYFSVDGDPARKATAAGFLQQLRDEDALRGTPYQTQAIELLNEIDDIFTVVTFPSRPAPVAVPGPVKVNVAPTDAAAVEVPVEISHVVSPDADAEASSQATDDE